MGRHQPRGQRSLTLLPAAEPCPVCAGERWVRLTGLIHFRRTKDVPCPVCNRHPDLPAVHVTANVKDVT